MSTDYTYDKIYDLFQAAASKIDLTGITIKDDTGKEWTVFSQYIVKIYLDVVDDEGSVATVVLSVEPDESD